MNWDDPTARFHLIEKVGPGHYNEMIQEHFRQSTLATVNGYSIRAVHCRFGRLYMVDGLDKGMATLEGAKALAAAAPPGGAP